jgi:hypothetical protein
VAEQPCADPCAEKAPGRRKRGGKHSLRAGAPRLLGRHDGQRGRWYREAWRALLAEFGDLGGLRRLEAGRVALAWVEVRAAAVALEDARRARDAGLGRRPSAAELRAMTKRLGLADGTYSQALDKLRAMAAPSRRLLGVLRGGDR